MNKSAWDQAGLAAAVDAYWDNANEVAFRGQVLAELQSALAPGAILDVGCGSGRIYEALWSAGLLLGRPYLGVDASRHMLALARQRYPNGRFIYGDAASFFQPSPNVLCIQVLQHMQDWQSVLTNLLRSTERLLYLVTWFGNGDGHVDPANGIWNGWLKGSDVEAVCKEAGFRVERGQIHEGTIGSLLVRRT